MMRGEEVEWEPELKGRIVVVDFYKCFCPVARTFLSLNCCTQLRGFY
jgi:hypothetical protein